MTFPDLDDEPRRGLPSTGVTLDPRVLRDLLALLLMLGGLLGIGVCAFQFDALLGWAYVSVVALASGTVLARWE